MAGDCDIEGFWGVDNALLLNLGGDYPSIGSIIQVLLNCTCMCNAFFFMNVIFNNRRREKYIQRGKII